MMFKISHHTSITEHIIQKLRDVNASPLPVMKKIPFRQQEMHWIKMTRNRERKSAETIKIVIRHRQE